ncbi:MAG: FecR family protein [Tannerellaceae bacterium]|jgi:ferric-dicitrate binding protein FerR (iron transport regulator)|nr:FecR family protein [Tannerellaceae bacterium]
MLNNYMMQNKDIQDKDILFENLMVEFLSGSISDENKIVLFALTEESEIYAQAYKERVKLNALLHVPMFEAQKQDKIGEFRKNLKKNQVKRKANGWLVYLRNTAAILLLMSSASLGTLFIYAYSEKNADTTFYETVVPFGSQTKIMLPDGSIAVLNSGSILKYPLSFGKKERDVFLEGEGYFEISKDQSKAFQVYAGEVKVRVTGTKFNICSYQEDQSIEVNLIEGSVDVIALNQSMNLKPNEKAVYSHVSGELVRLPSESYKAALWTTGKLSFVNTSFVDILKDIERKYNIKIHVESKRVQNESFSGSINLTMPLKDIFNFIDVDHKYIFERTGDVIILKDR